jgi:hypothetical protein
MMRILMVALLLLAPPAWAGDYDTRRDELIKWVDGLDSTKKEALKQVVRTHATAVETCLASLGTIAGSADCKDESACKDQWLKAVQTAAASANDLSKNLAAADADVGNKNAKDLTSITSEEQQFVNALVGAAGIAAGIGKMGELGAKVADHRSKVVDTVVPQLIKNGGDTNKAANDSFTTLRNRIHEMERALARADLLCMDAVQNAAKSLGLAIGDFEQIKGDYQRWDQRIVELRRLYNEDVQQIANVMCEYGKDAPQTATAVRSVTDRVKSEVSSAYQTIDSVGKGLQSRISSLSQAAPTAEATKLSDTITKRLSSVERSTRGINLGSANPKVKAYQERGDGMHDRMQASCHASEVTVGSYRLDCVNVSSGTCTLIEIKPDNSAGRNRGYKELADKMSALNSEWSSARTSQSGRDSFFSGRKAIFKGCYNESTNDLNLQSKVDTYPQPCPVPFEEIADRLDDYN